MATENRHNGTDELIYFKAMILQAIALTWKDSTFKEAFLADPKKALLDYFEYDYPYETNFFAIPYDASAEWQGMYSKKPLAPSGISLVLPLRPTNSDGSHLTAEEEGIALAKYNVNNLTFLPLA